MRAANVLFKSTNEGQTWQPISADLTRNDKSRQGSSGGPITKDNTSIEYYCTIFTVMRSRSLRRACIWVGSDDGLIHVTRDGGKNWQKVTPPDMPEWIQINSIDAGPFDAGTAYVAATMYRHDDFKPYLFKTNDYGKTWKKITTGIPDPRISPGWFAPTRTRRGLLYAGTETRLAMSRSTTATTGSRCSSTCRLCRSPISWYTNARKTSSRPRRAEASGCWTTPLCFIRWRMRRADAYLFKPEDSYRMPGGGHPAAQRVRSGPTAR